MNYFGSSFIFIYFRQGQQKKVVAQANDSNNNNMSPLSVLEASISNRSFLSSSLDDGLGTVLKCYRSQIQIRSVVPSDFCPMICSFLWYVM